VELAIAISVPLERVIQLVALLIFCWTMQYRTTGPLHKELKALMSATTFCTCIGVVLVFPFGDFFHNFKQGCVFQMFPT
jgi:hypothetical protein